MNVKLITDYSDRTDLYNFHSHSEFCDGKAPIASISRAAYDKGFEIWGVTPHSPICVESSCNMLPVDVVHYVETMDRLKAEYEGRMTLLTGMEIDHISRDFGPHTDYFQKMPLDYRIGSVHFVPNQEGIPLDCDGSFKRFSMYLHRGYADDLRYVVEKYFEQVLTMLELGGFEILGHFDKIIGNASEADPAIEEQGWYCALAQDVVSFAQSTGVVVEINTKAIETKGRYFPAEKWWKMLMDAEIPIVVNSDCHHPDLTDIGRADALERLKLQRH